LKPPPSLVFLGNKYQQHGSARCVISVTLQGTVHPYPHQTGSSENYPSSKVPTGRGYVSSQGSVILKVEDVFSPVIFGCLAGFFGKVGG